MAILGWLIGGSSIFSQAALVGITLLISSLITAPTLYFKGRADCANAAEVAGLKSQVKDLSKQLEIRDWLDELSKEQVKENVDVDAHNQKIDEAVKDAIDRAPVVDNCATGDFLERLRNLR